jgi:hypothetical protein
VCSKNTVVLQKPLLISKTIAGTKSNPPLASRKIAWLSCLTRTKYGLKSGICT